MYLVFTKLQREKGEGRGNNTPKYTLKEKLRSFYEIKIPVKDLKFSDISVNFWWTLLSWWLCWHFMLRPEEIIRVSPTSQVSQLFPFWCKLLNTKEIFLNLFMIIHVSSRFLYQLFQYNMNVLNLYKLVSIQVLTPFNVTVTLYYQVKNSLIYWFRSSGKRN